MKMYRRKVICLENGVSSKAYDDIDDFTDGMAMVRLNGLYGFIDEELNEIVSPKYEKAHNFANGFAIVKTELGWGAIDKTGEEVVKPSFNYLGDFNSCGLAPFEFAKRSGAIDSTGNIVVKAKYETRIEFHDGFARVRRAGKWGFIDERFTEVFPVKLDIATDFMAGRAFVVLDNGEFRHINKKFEFI